MTPRHSCPVAAAVWLAVAFAPPASGAEPLPAPTGKYPVGRVTYHLVDPTRDDERGTRKDGRREFVVHIWYPTKAGAAGKPAPWVPADLLNQEEKGFVGMLLRKSSAPAAKDVPTVLKSVMVHAREDNPLTDSPARFPVLLFAAGSQQIPSEYSCLTEDLASRGFVVVGYGPTVMGGRTWREDLTHVLDQLGVWNTNRGHCNCREHKLLSLVLGTMEFPADVEPDRMHH